MPLVQTGWGTVFTGTNQVTVAPPGALNSPAYAPLTVLGPTPQTTLPPSGMVGGSANVQSVQDYSQSTDAGSSKSPVWPTIILLLVSVIGLHLIFWRDGGKEG
jgi:hypothetical protein